MIATEGDEMNIAGLVRAPESSRHMTRIVEVKRLSVMVRTPESDCPALGQKKA
jgi:hypothetical protein